MDMEQPSYTVTVLPERTDRRLKGRKLALAWAASLAVSALVLGVWITSITAALQHEAQGAPAGEIALDLTLSVGFFAGYLAPVAIVLWQRPRDWLALLAGVALLAFGLTLSPALNDLQMNSPEWTQIYTLMRGLGQGLLFLFLYLFPNGQFQPRWTRFALFALLAVHIVFLTPLAAGVIPDIVGFVAWLFFLASVVIAQIYRYARVSTRVERQQTKWVVVGVAAMGLGLALAALAESLIPALAQPNTLGETVVGIVTIASALCLPTSIAVAMLRYRLWDVDILINRALVYGALTACVIAIYVVVVGYLGALFRTGGNLVVSLTATGVVALLFQPLREWFQRGVNRLLYGQRDEPYLVVTRLSQRVESSLTHETILPTIVETVAQALKLPYVAIALREGEDQVIAASYGALGGRALRLPLIYQAEPIGELILSPRAPGDSWTPADRRLLDELARQAGVAARAVRLTSDLQRSRERLVLAREEERRRLRRDLHDGLGPTLGNLTLQLDVVDDLIESDPPAAHDLVAKVKHQTQLAIGEIRRLVDDLRPAALDELGLIAALREQAAHYNQLGALRVEVDAPNSLPSLPAAVEVAAYRIAVEGLRNAARHAEARRCAIQLRLDDGLTVDISDDGKGVSAQARPGVGINSMRERAAELGGTCAISTAPQGGTRVFARLPLAVR
jgi:signal transduction histidine kinase